MLPYFAIWAEFPDVQRVLTERSVGPTMKWSDGGPNYTLPKIHDPNTNVAVEESTAIAEYLDETYPNMPQLIPGETATLRGSLPISSL